MSGTPSKTVKFSEDTKESPEITPSVAFPHMIIHAWHDLDVGSSELFNALIEIPKGSKIKYQYDTKYGLLKVSHILSSSLTYPANYGFIPQTFGEDKDPIDVLVLMQSACHPMSIVRCHPIGVMPLIDNGVMEYKVIAVHADDPEYRGINELSQLRPHILNEIKIFYEDYKKLDKNTQTVVVKDFLPRSEAMKIIEQGIEGYKQYIREQKKSLTCTRYGSYQNLFKKGLNLSDMDDEDDE
ncbi:hypothetical protein C9374_014310 [Naegleria lovaniensis]|uniref:inorganic diphosphatase n=1 Tax=Naegleria lovaniensis TaxID=51637 RepID=A0AA88GCK5_NAELO|nr:uncharacterized protein C9374_014310 [Naegleria lovaniensis]KAG2370699.1 hypothetical protein C9374_014310 [Naegleria lovaniensis]